jgi:hypothetical protein
MRKLLFLERLTLISNILFVVCLIMQRTQDIIPSQDIKGIIIVLGWFLSPFLNLAANIWLGVLLVKKQSNQIPVWLAMTNLLFLFVEIFKHFIIP